MTTNRDILKNLSDELQRLKIELDKVITIATADYKKTIKNKLMEDMEDQKENKVTSTTYSYSKRDSIAK
ncbi:hypothetical protein TAO_1172 [Candidatus Nitrosoglobus terrae]|uniref:Uncharacterized protein n=1 Tax=Candidatus Nitrosoglobus terrae TaxID=1630141 RepID=A0A1Q2SN49_9GAMM|nr:hypothetical protein [Candidatus Nitrosoglobus terrae]BAW80542.1 hypothetical protein TAO_1172 [Candidatus Nitrosoglobus terrae]